MKASITELIKLCLLSRIDLFRDVTAHNNSYEGEEKKVNSKIRIRKQKQEVYLRYFNSFSTMRQIPSNSKSPNQSLTKLACTSIDFEDMNQLFMWEFVLIHTFHFYTVKITH